MIDIPTPFLSKKGTQYINRVAGTAPTRTSGPDQPSAIRTSWLSSPSTPPSSSEEFLSSGSAAGLFAKSSRSSCRCSTDTTCGGLFSGSSSSSFADLRGPPKCKGASSPLSSSSSLSWLFDCKGLLESSRSSASLFPLEPSADSAFCWLCRARRAASWRRARLGGTLRGGGAGGGSVGGLGVTDMFGWLGRNFADC